MLIKRSNDEANLRRRKMIFDFEIPEIIDIEQVDGSPKPRKMNIGSEALRQEKVKITDGKPITEFKGKTS